MIGLVACLPFTPQLITEVSAAPLPAILGMVYLGAVVLVPLILGYTAYSSWVFRGKVKAVGGYH